MVHLKIRPVLYLASSSHVRFVDVSKAMMFVNNISFEAVLMLICFVVMMVLSRIAVSYLRHDLWLIQDRCDKASNKAEFCEARMMRMIMRPHEYVRTLMQLLEEFDERGDPSYLVRQFSDLCTMFVEARMRHWSDLSNMPDAMHLLRYCLRITVDRVRKAEDQVSMNRLRVLAQFELRYAVDNSSLFPFACEAILTPNVFDGDDDTVRSLRVRVQNGAYGYEVYGLTDHFQVTRDLWR